MRRVGFVLLLLAACGDNNAAKFGVGDDDDGSHDAGLDAPIDAAVDAAPTSQHLSGTIKYEDRAPKLNGSGGTLGNPTPVPARFVSLQLFSDATSQVIASAVTGADGTYAMDYVAAADEMVHLTAIAQSSDPLRPIKIIGRSNLVHAAASDPFPAGQASADLTVTSASGEAEAFNIFDEFVRAFDKIHEIYNDPSPTPLSAVWFKGNNDGTYYDGAKIHLLGATSDDDGYDDTVMLHEFGHYVAANQGRDDSPGGSHDGSPADARLAWSEGWATYWEMAVHNAPLYIDTNAGGGFNQNSDTEVTVANVNGPMSQDVSEEMVTEILWDLADAGGGDDDTVAGTHLAVSAVQTYLKTATLRNVGHAGVDLVDFLDGWFLTAGLTPCAGVKDIVTTKRSFPYDYNGPAGLCP